MAAIDRPRAAESREDYDINNPWTDPVNGGEWWFSPTKVRWHPVPAGGGASVSDAAYDATSWNGVTDEAPSKNAVRDKFESLPTVTVDTTIINGSTNAVSSNAVFDALALKAPLASPAFTGTVTAANAGSGAGAGIYSDSGTGADIYSNSGTYHATFGNTGIDRSFVARLKGAFGWIRGAFTGRIHPPDTLTGNQTWELPDASGTLALTSDINTLAKLDTLVADATLARTDAGQTFAGPQAFSSTTRPTSAGTGTPAATSLITATDSNNQRRRYRTFSTGAFTGGVIAYAGAGTPSPSIQPFYIAGQCGATLSGYSSVQIGGSYLAAQAGGDRITANFSKKIAVTWDVIVPVSTSTVNETYYLWPVNSTYTTGRFVTQKGLGFIIIGMNIYGCTNDGTTHRITTAYVTAVSNSAHSLRVESDGGGSASFYINGTFLETLTAPTGTQTNAKAAVASVSAIEASNSQWYALQHFSLEVEI